MYVSGNGEDNNGLIVDLKDPGKDVASLTVPAGSYLISANLMLYNMDSDDQTARCTFNTGASKLAKLEGFEEIQLEVTDTATFIGNTTIVLHCTGFNYDADATVLTAVKVATLH